MTIYVNNQILNDLFEQPTTFEELQTILEQINENFTNINADALGKDDTYFTVKEVSASANLTRNVRPQYVKCSLTGVITLTLPVQNADGTHLKKNDTFFIIDSTRNSETYNITVDLNGGEVDGDASDIVIAKNGGFLWLRYSGWDAINEVGTFEIVMSELLPNTLNNILDETYVVGDILYASATDALSKLAGNTTTSKKFLRSLGNGTIASAPSWETISMSDLTAPTGTVSFGSQSISGLNNISGASLNLSGDATISEGYLYVKRTSGNPQITILSYSVTSTDGSNLMLQRAKGGSFSSFTAVQSGDVLGAIQTLGATGANTWGNVNSQIQIVATENYTGSATGTNMNFQTTATGTTSRTTKFIVGNDGSATVGSSLGTGTGALFAGATTVTTLTGSGVVNIDSGTFYIDPVNNRVGINTSSPSYSLHCTGTSYFTSTVTILSGQIISSSASANSFLNLDDSGNGVFASRSSLIFNFDYDNNQTDAVAKFRVNNATDVWYINENGSVTQDYIGTTGRALNLNASSITTDGIARLYSNSGDTSSRNLLNIINDNASATGAKAISIQQNSSGNALFIGHNLAGTSIEIDADDNSATAMYGLTMAIDNAGAGLEYAFRFNGSEIVSSAVGGSQDKKMRVSVAGTDYFVPLHTA